MYRGHQGAGRSLWGPVKPVALVGVLKDLGGREASHPLVQVLESKARSTWFWMCYQILFSKKNKLKKKSVFCRSENFDWICSLDFTERCGRDMEWAESAKIRWPAAGGPGLWLTFCTRWKKFRKSVPSGVYMPMYHMPMKQCITLFQEITSVVFWGKQKCMMGGLLLSIPVGS